jgi:hypothetical protein
VTPEKDYTESGMQSDPTKEVTKPLEVTNQMSDDAILAAPNFDSKTTSTVSPGDKFRMTSSQADSLVNALQSTTWPMNARTVVDGFGTCLGPTYDRGTPRLAAYTKPYAQLTREINEAIRNTLGDKQFYWGSLQINKNSVSSRHTDKNNEGLSLIILLGDFSGGSFVTQDRKLTSD